MNSNKRRQITKAPIQTQIQFPQTKGQGLPQYQREEFAKILEAKSNYYDQQIGAKDSSTPYRSVNRVNSLLKASPYLAQHGHAKLIETPAKFSFQMNSFEFSKPSSATTAYTNAPSEYSSYRNDLLLNSSKNKREQKSDRKNPTQRRLIGQKRPAQLKLNEMEHWTRLCSSAAKFVVKNLKLRDKKTGRVYDFSMFNENDIEGFRNNPIIKDFDMTKLEVEYDYDTDSEQLTYSAKMLWQDLEQAIDFFIVDDPLKLVDNILL